MCSRFLSALLLVAALVAGSQAGVLRVCAEPNKLPFSNRAGQGLENRLAELVARETGADFEMAWPPRGQACLKHKLLAGACDAVVGLPAEIGVVPGTAPYCRSTYVALAREPGIGWWGDRLVGFRTGIHMTAGHYAPPAAALARRGMVANGEPNPPSRIVEAVAAGTIDIAAVRGPFAGCFAPRAATKLCLTPAPYQFAIAVGVARGREALREEIDAVLKRRRREIGRILSDFGVPRCDGPAR